MGPAVSWVRPRAGLWDRSPAVFPTEHSPRRAKSRGWDACPSKGATFLYDGVLKDPGVAAADWDLTFLR